MEFLAVNFHYIGNTDLFDRGIFPISQEKFYYQLSELKKYFTFVGQNDVLNAISNKRQMPEKSCMISFDDGLKCQYKFALPVLKDLEIPAVFFVSTFPYVCHEALLVHKIHWCQAHLSQNGLLEKFSFYFEKFTGQVFSFEIFRNLDSFAQYQYPYDNIIDARLKYLLNKDMIGMDIRKKIIDSIFDFIEPVEQKFIENFYVSKEEICDLFRLTYLGFHGHNHNILSLLSREEIDKDFEVGKNVLQDILRDGLGDKNFDIRSISYPHGTEKDLSPTVFELAGKHGFRFGLTMKRQINKSLNNSLELCRVDCNDIPGGKSPVFLIDRGKLVYIKN